MGRTIRPGRLLLMVVAAVVVLAVAGLSVAPPSRAQAVEGWVVERLTNDLTRDNAAVVRGDDVVWASGPDFTSCTISWRDCLAGVTRVLTDRAFYPLPVLYDGSWVVWQEGTGTNAEIWAYDTEHMGGYRVTTNVLVDTAPVLDEGYAAWTRFDGHDMEIYLCHLASGHVVALTNDGVDQQVLAMRGPLVVWTTGGAAPLLVVHDRASHTSTTLATGPMFDPSVEVDDGRVFWTERVSGDLEILMWESGHGTRNLSDNSLDDRFPSASGSSVAWITSMTDGQQEVRVLDLNTGVLQQLFRGTQVFPATVRQGRVVWSGRVPGTESPAAFLYDGKYRRTVKLSGDDWGAVGVTLDGARAGWIAWAAASGDPNISELFTAHLPRFTDVTAGNPYATVITTMQYLGLVSGYHEGDHWAFHPAEPVRRAQFAKMADGMMILAVDEGMTSPFTDLGADDPNGLYPHEYVAAAAEHGIALGITPTQFGPYLDISRAQAVTMVVRAIQNLGGPGMLLEPPSGYAGALGDFDGTHGPTMRLAEGNGLLAGLVGFGPAWDPWAAASRGEVARSS